MFSLILCEFISFFSTVKFKLGHGFSQFTCRFKLRFLNVGLRLYFQLFPNSQNDWKLGILNVALVGLSSFSKFVRWKIRILYTTLGCNFHQRVGKLGCLNYPQFHILSGCENSLSPSGMCRRGVTNLDKTATVSVKKCPYLCNNFVSV